MGKFVFVTNGQYNGVSVYSVDDATGALSAVAGSPFTTGTEPDALAIDASAEVLDVANGGSANVSVYAINRSAGPLTAVIGSPFAAGTSPTAVVLHWGYCCTTAFETSTYSPSGASVGLPPAPPIAPETCGFSTSDSEGASS
jgi:hypothetical protein